MHFKIENWVRSKAQISPEDEEEFLREKLESGELSPARLSLAAQLGYSTANIIQPSTAKDPEGSPQWWKRLSTWGTDTAVRAALVMILPMKKIWEEAHSDDRGLIEKAVSIAQQWVEEPTEELEREAREIDDPHEMDEDWQMANRTYDTYVALHAAMSAASTCVTPSAVWEVATMFNDCLEYEDSAIDLPVIFEESGVLPTAHDMVKLSLVPWALNYYDPLEKDGD